MTDNTNDICECTMFDFGDFVRSRQNPHLTGQIIGERNFGDEYHVRLADGASTIWWFAIEIEHDIDTAEEVSNVISLAEVKAAKGRMH